VEPCIYDAFYGQTLENEEVKLGSSHCDGWQNCMTMYEGFHAINEMY
jgi:hypothetical protein